MDPELPSTERGLGEKKKGTAPPDNERRYVFSDVSLLYAFLGAVGVLLLPLRRLDWSD